MEKIMLTPGLEQRKADELLILLKTQDFSINPQYIKEILSEFPNLVNYQAVNYKVEGHEFKNRTMIPFVVVAILNDFIAWEIVEIFLQHGANIMNCYIFEDESNYQYEIDILNDLDDHYIVNKEVNNEWQILNSVDQFPIVASKMRKLKNYLNTI